VSDKLRQQFQDLCELSQKSRELRALIKVYDDSYGTQFLNELLGHWLNTDLRVVKFLELETLKLSKNTEFMEPQIQVRPIKGAKA